MAEALEGNSLHAFGLATGKLYWEQGKRDGDRTLQKGFFLGPPLVMGDTLLALHEKDSTLRVVRLAAKTGQLLDTRSLGKLTTSLGTDATASRRAHHLVVARDALIVPTGCGALLALDLPTLRLRWRYDYETSDKPGPGIEYRPQVVGDRLYYTGPDSQSLHVVDLQTGKAVWTTAMQEGDRFLAGVQGDSVLVVGSKGVRALKTENGAVRWTAEVGTAAGEGYFGASDRYYLPVAGKDGDTVVVVDLKSGAVATKVAMPADLRLGNLLPVGEMIVSVSPFSIAVFPQVKAR
jgi:outer membrane protein assembly factor BamB